MSKIDVRPDADTLRQIETLGERLTSCEKQVQDESDLGQKYVYAHRLKQVCQSALERCVKARDEKIDKAVSKNRFRDHINHGLYVGGVMAGLFFCAVNFIPVGIAVAAVCCAAAYAGEKGKGPLATSPVNFTKPINDTYQPVMDQAVRIRNYSSSLCEKLERDRLAELSISSAIQNNLRFLPDLSNSFALIGLKTLSTQPHYKNRNKDIGYNVWLKPMKKTNN